MINTPSLLTSAAYIALLLAVVALWFGRRLWVAALVVAVVLGYVANVLHGPAVVWIAAFAALCLTYERAKRIGSRSRRALGQSFAAIGIIVLGVLLAMHVLPGFHNFQVLDEVVLSSGAEPYTLYLNFDKTVVGICLLGLCYRGLLTRRSQWRQAVRPAAPVALASILVVGLGAVSLGYLTWQPKWTSLFAIWAPVNLLFVCLSEEAFFRGFIQRELAAALQGSALGSTFGSALAVVVSAILFGLAHFAGGVSYMVLATAAGLGYALVYQRSASVEMSMLAHFALNTVHFLLFTYPRAI